ncbi:MAG: stage II sporulation protein R [Bacteroides sp.]|nr:stage II sporulation protein R [Eubacterium sp.]MCM1418770.1 stage II sporulation protein R [Roseburia sp.]MCM1462015.1 stage II sporulation protein R [Bacteroides sp.]
MRIHERTLDLALLLGAAAAILCAVFFDFTADCEELRGNAFRLHILANSDSAEDQRIKYALRDYILDDLGYLFRSADTKEKTVLLARRSLPLISERANAFLAENDCGYGAVCTVEKCDFTTRRYGDYTLPAGEYDALRIVLGAGEGRNWWCVLYPSICLSAASEPSALPSRALYEEQKESARRTADSLAIENGEGIELRFALYEWLCKVFGF